MVTAARIGPPANTMRLSAATVETGAPTNRTAPSPLPQPPFKPPVLQSSPHSTLSSSRVSESLARDQRLRHKTTRTTEPFCFGSPDHVRSKSVAGTTAVGADDPRRLIEMEADAVIAEP